ncbi:MAG: DUF2490 domain-containing protein [Acidobacteriota bacterium]
MRRIALLIALFLFLLSAAPVSADDDFQLWSQFSIPLAQWDQLTLSLYAEGRFSNDVSDLAGVFVGPKLTYKAHPNLSLGLAIKRIDLDGDVGLGDFRADGGGPEIDGRLELELAPRFSISDRWRFDSRHRMELIHRETRSDRTRFRHLTRWTRALGDSSRWSHLFFANELFHEDGDDLFDVNENRFVPIGFQRGLADGSTLSLFYLIQSREIDGDWSHNHVIGTTWSPAP